MKLYSKALPALSLFGSLSTLICCALPALFVGLGMGAVLIGVVSAVPQLIWISENKALVFSLAGIFLAVNGVWLYSQRNAPCPIDPVLRDACISGRKWSLRIYSASVVTFLIGLFFLIWPLIGQF